MKSNIEESSVTNDTYNTNVTNDTYNTNGCVTCVLCDNADPHSLFGENTTEKILSILALEKNIFTYDKLAERLGKTTDNIRQAINRNRDYFLIKKPDGKICHTYLSQMAIDEISSRISSHNQKINEKNQLHAKLENDKIFKENYRENVLGFILSKKIKRNKNSLIINYNDILEHDFNLADSLLENPIDFLNTIKDHFETENIQLINLPEYIKINVEQIRTKHLNKVICISGRVVTLSDIRPQVVNSSFECPSCGTIISILQIEKKFREPSRCSCGRRGSFKLIKKEVIDTARLILEDLQEKTDNPHSKRLNCFLKGNLLSHEIMNLYNPGNEVEITGILKEIPVELKNGGVSTRMDIAMEVISIVQAKEEITIDNLSDSEVEEIHEVANKIDENGLDELVDSFAPEIFGHNKIKESIILQLASSRNEFNSLNKKNRPNILLIGDPGSAKTVLGQFAVSITPGARKSVGGSASAVGFTGAVVRDEFSGGWRLEPGAMVLAKDFFMLDELNNVKDEDKPRLQEALSENTITFDKATIHTKLPATSGVLGTANPIHGIFNDNEDLVKQFNLSPPIINRFDLIFIVRDVVNEDIDKLIAKKMNDREINNIQQKYSSEFLKKFFVYIKEQKNPIITTEISEIISVIYSKLRRYKSDSLNINPRVHIAFLQLLKASAKIRLSDKIEIKDIERVLDILSYSYFNTPKFDLLKCEIDKIK